MARRASSSSMDAASTMASNRHQRGDPIAGEPALHSAETATDEVLEIVLEQDDARLVAIAGEAGTWSSDTNVLVCKLSAVAAPSQWTAVTAVKNR